MRFVCDSCRAQYMISDEKVGAKGVKVRCKKCGYVILVRRPEPTNELAETQVMTSPVASEPSGEPPVPSTSNDNPFAGGEDSLFAGADDEIGAVFDQVLSGGAGSPTPSAPSLADDDDEVAQTRVVDASTIQKLAAETAERDDDEKTETHAPAVATHDWYVAIEDKQQGPLSLDKMRELWGRGEIGPDSLCWRAGFSDWLPLSEVGELTSSLAPRSAKPVISAAASLSPASSAVVDTPAGEAGQGDGGSDWQPSAASALASLVKDEIEALTRPAAKPAQNAAVGSLLGGAGGGLLDMPAPAPVAAPPQEPGLIPSVPPSEPEQATAPRGTPLTAPESAPMPAKPAPFVPPPYAYSAPQQGSRKGLIIGLSAGGAVVLILLLTVVYLVARTPSAPVPAPVPVAQVTPPPAPHPVPAQQPVAQATPPAQQPVAQATPPATQPAAQVPAKAQPATEPAKAEVAKELAKAETPARHEPAVEEHHTRRTTSTRRSSAREEEVASAEPETKPAKASGGGGGADAFDAIFGGGGGGGGDSQPAQGHESRHKSVYVPPAPGSADIPDQLGESDIMQVVLSQKPAIFRCVQEQKAKDPNLSGRLVMRWTILTSGRTSSVAVASPEFRSTHMASCISGLIKGMHFPRHKTQGPPINFPFTF